MSHEEIAALVKQKAGLIGPDDLKKIFHSNRNYAADLVLDQLDKLRDRGSSTVILEEQEIDLKPALMLLKNWDRCENLESRGAVLFREFWRLAQINTGIWKIAFDPNDPLTTPRDLDIERQEVADFLKNALARSVQTFFEFELPLDISIGEAQQFPIKNGFISISGGDGSAGVLNLIDFGPLGRAGYKPVAIQGTSYTQIVTWEGGRVVADAILPCSQSSDIDSPHYADQTRLFMSKGWVRLPFTETEIKNDSIQASKQLKS